MITLLTLINTEGITKTEMNLENNMQKMIIKLLFIYLTKNLFFNKLFQRSAKSSESGGIGRHARLRI